MNSSTPSHIKKTNGRMLGSWTDTCRWSYVCLISMLWSQHHHCCQKKIPQFGFHCWYVTIYMPALHKDVLRGLGKKGKCVYCKHLIYVFRILSKVDFHNDRFNHAPTNTANELMQLLELPRLIEHKRLLLSSIYSYSKNVIVWYYKLILYDGSSIM